MPNFYTKSNLSAFLQSGKNRDKNLGLVPTMGALHSGHLSLVKKAIDENDLVVVSIFVNPTQFNNTTDLEKYPRNLERDIELLKELSEQIIIFAPSVEEIYKDSVKSKTFEFDGLDKVMEGAFREGHFEGVGTIVELLLRAVDPNRAYFGEKDFQQLQIIKKLVENEHIPVQIVGCPIEREPHGLAMSSRNERLSPQIRQKADVIHKTLQMAREKFGTENAKSIVDWVKTEFGKSESFQLEYFTIADENHLIPIEEKIRNKKYRAFIAVYAEDVRLIDNLRLN